MGLNVKGYSMSQKAIGFGVMAAFVALSVGACANGLIATEDGGKPRPDAGKVNDGSTTIPKDSSTPIQDGTTCSYTVCGNLCVDTSMDDSNCGSCGHACSGGTTCSNSTCQCSGGMTLCTSGCTDTNSDNANCGSCGNACTGTSTCSNGTCSTTTTTSAPPQGSCAHDLCTASVGALNPGCDPNGCVTNVCNNDSFCCDTINGDWDSLCVSEVATYCPPYSCP